MCDADDFCGLYGPQDSIGAKCFSLTYVVPPPSNAERRALVNANSVAENISDPTLAMRDSTFQLPLAAPTDPDRRVIGECVPGTYRCAPNQPHVWNCGTTTMWELQHECDAGSVCGLAENNQAACYTASYPVTWPPEKANTNPDLRSLGECEKGMTRCSPNEGLDVWYV